VTGEEPAGLRPACLSTVEVLAQSIANIAPTATPALIIPLVFASAGNGTWLVYVIATVGLILVGLNINRFAERSASAGSLFAFATEALRPELAGIAGWALFLAYLFTAASVPLAFANYAGVVFGLSGPGSALVLASLCTTLSFWIAYRDVQLSTKAMLGLELVSVGLIALLAAVVLARVGLHPDLSQLSLKGVTPQGLRLGLVLAVFSYVGFESATALGDEARDPLRTIPRSVIASVAAVGLFFVLMSYVEVQGFQGAAVGLDKSTAPLAELANRARLPWVGFATSVGAMVSFFACCLASINAGARVLFAMARGGLLHARAGAAHAQNATPHVAVTLTAMLVLLIPAGVVLSGATVLDAYAYLGTLATFGFLVDYILISLAVPGYLRRQGRLRGRDVVVSAAAALFMVLPLVGSVYPVPAPPYDRLPYLFLLLLALGAIWRLPMLRGKTAPARSTSPDSAP
jgi:amino acid transporter